MEFFSAATQPENDFKGYRIEHQRTRQPMKRSCYKHPLRFSKNLFRSLDRIASSAMVSMYGTVTLFAIIGAGILPLHAQVTMEVLWQRCIGGSDYEFGTGFIPTSDGGFFCMGLSQSSDGDAIGFHGGIGLNDILATKLNADGTIQWRRMLGGSGNDISIGCFEASDGSYVVAGMSTSADGDLTFNHGANDVWVLKLSPLGAIIWQHSYGGSSSDLGSQIQETLDGGFVIMGVTTSDDGDVVGYHPAAGPVSPQDVWVFKIDASGTLEWSRALGGSGYDVNGALVPSMDGGYLVSFSYTESIDGDITNYHGNGDGLLLKLNANGSIAWTRTIGGSQQDGCTAILELTNGDVLLSGSSRSSDGDFSLNQGGADVFLMKFSGTGGLIWQRTYGGSLDDSGGYPVRTADGGYLISGASNSSDGDVPLNQGGSDAWSIKVDASGLLMWKRSFGGSQSESAGIAPLEQGGYMLSGITNSNDGDVQGNHGDQDIWFARLDEDVDLAWQRCFGGSAEDRGSVLPIADNCFMVFGNTESNDGDVSGNHGGYDMWVAKFKVTEPTEPLECALYIPNAFSPNASGKNDTQCIYGTECIATMAFNIFNRWGNKVFESTNPNVCWDGTYNGQALDPAVFVYHLSATMNNGEQVERQGNISLVR